MHAVNRYTCMQVFMHVYLFTLPLYVHTFCRDSGITLKVNCLKIALDHVLQWTQTWQMKYNVTKCTVIKCTRSQSVISRDCILQDHVLETRTQSTYLGITLNNTLSWLSHLNKTASRVSKTLNILRCNLH